MNELLILGGIVGGIWLLVLALRVPASVAFFSLLVGQLLATEAGNEVYDFLSSVLRVNQEKYVQLGLLLLPFVLTVIFMRGRAKKSSFAIELVPALFVALVTVLLAVPFLPELKDMLTSATDGRNEQYRSVVLLAAAVAGLFSAWMSYPKPHDKHSKHK